MRTIAKAGNISVQIVNEIVSPIFISFNSLLYDVAFEFLNEFDGKSVFIVMKRYLNEL